MESRQGWLQLSYIQLGGAISLPVLLVGYFLGSRFSVQSCLAQIVLGNLCLLALSSVYMVVIDHHKVITIDLARIIFGKGGVIICGVSMMVALIGWSIIQMNMIQVALLSQMGHQGELTSLLLSLTLGLVIYMLIGKGLNYFALMNKFLLPCVVVALCVAYFMMPAQSVTFIPQGGYHFLLGLVMVITVASGMVFDLPTYYRHAATIQDARLSFILIFALVVPAMEGFGVYLATHTQGVTAGGSVIGNLFGQINQAALLFLILSSVLSNCLNLYSASMVVNSFVKVRYKAILMILCLSCALISMMNMDENFSVILEVINVVAEIIVTFTLVYVFFNGVTMYGITSKERVHHERMLYLILSVVILTRLMNVTIFNDLFIDVGFLSLLSMSLYCGMRRVI